MTEQTAELGGDGVYLRSFLQPLEPWLSRSDITEILINRPGEIWIETNTSARMERIGVPDLTATALTRLVAQVARANHQGVNRANPLLSGLLPGGERIQIVAPPATRAHVAIAIRKHVSVDLDLADYEAAGAFATVGSARPHIDDDLRTRLDNGAIRSFFEAAVAARKTILVSGGTSSGKTTFLNALLKQIPPYERVITIEDTPEVSLDRPNSLGLIAARGRTGEAAVTPEELLQAALRMRPDRLLLGEMRGAEAFSFLRAVNTGHPGSISTIHANSCAGAIEQVALLAVQAGANLGRAEIISYALSVIGVIVQLKRSPLGQRVIGEITLTAEM